MKLGRPPANAFGFRAAQRMVKAMEFGVVYDHDGPDRSDPEGWRLSWDYNSRFKQPLRFKLPGGKIVTIQQSCVRIQWQLHKIFEHCSRILYFCRPVETVM